MTNTRIQEVTKSEGAWSVGQVAIRLGCAMALVRSAGCLAPCTLNQVAMASDRLVTEGLVEYFVSRASFPRFT